MEVNSSITGNYYNYNWFNINKTVLTFALDANADISSENAELTEEQRLDVKGLYIGSGNLKIKYLPVNANIKFPSVIAYQAYNCSVQRVNDDHFKDLFELETVHLTRNKISFISSDAFKDLVNLKFLNLAINKLTLINKKVFRNLQKLESFNLSWNEIEFVSVNAFDSMTELRNASLSYNNIQAIFSEHFVNNRKLENVWLNDNKIKHIDSGLFNNHNYLILVNFNRNSCIKNEFCDKIFICSNKLNEINNKIALC